MLIHHDRDFLDALGASTREEARKAIYKVTECGAWLAFTDDSVRVGSIVEGSSAEVSARPLRYPFAMADFWSALEEVNAEACALWDEANLDD